MINVILFFFFFQAEDGIRDLIVTGVQTCALPICPWLVGLVPGESGESMTGTAVTLSKAEGSPGPLERPAARRRRSQKLRRNLSAHGFLIGAVLCFALFSWYPMAREIIMSFQKTHLGVTTWAGLQNYSRIFHDPTFWTAWRNTLEFTGLALVFGYAVPFFTAILLNELRHARGYLRVLVYLPVMLPPASALLLFAYFYDPTYGLFNRILQL